MKDRQNGQKRTKEISGRLLESHPPCNPGINKTPSNAINNLEYDPSYAHRTHPREGNGR